TAAFTGGAGGWASFRTEGERTKPATLLYPIGLSQLWVTAAARVDQDVRVVALRVSGGPFTPDPCGDHHRERRRPPAGYDQVVETRPHRTITDSDVPFDSRWDPAYSRGVTSMLRLEEGTSYTVCMYWESVPGAAPT